MIVISSRSFEYPTNSCARYGEENLQITVINIGLIPTVYPKYIATKINYAYMSTPYVTTPFFLRYFNSCRLNSIDSKEEEIFVMNSEASVLPSGNNAIRIKSIDRQRTMYMKKRAIVTRF